MKNLKSWILTALILSATGCATVPMETIEADKQAKAFSQPTSDKAGVYIYRDSMLGAALYKTIKIDGFVIGSSAPEMYFHIYATPGKRVFATQSEFSDNTLELNLEGGKNHFIRNYMKFGVFVGGADLEVIEEAEAKAAISESCKLATPSGGKEVY